MLRIGEAARPGDIVTNRLTTLLQYLILTEHAMTVRALHQARVTVSLVGCAAYLSSCSQQLSGSPIPPLQPRSYLSL